MLEKATLNSGEEIKSVPILIDFYLVVIIQIHLICAIIDIVNATPWKKPED